MSDQPLRRVYEVIKDEVEIIVEYDHEYIHKQFVNDTAGVSICSTDNMVWLPWADVQAMIDALTKAKAEYERATK